ncbi:putative ankyrin repeat protein [Acanthamoeba castellanii mimivirus]|uniref:Putative ankyrin repeat protein L100 n=5 Tax=Mimivirus TaxID=315393 RepID=YL100_MIMIV|nr:putative ankyrin repeat protein [Acanthamoeba polyphaga mimivirus]Q5UPH0.1 RecName: Full=Putative ankyrin repeat protein L100 [Acanthamoeba polyphaga mimivirus]AHA45777.1 putative ankyrin repeat protein [Hirudovirus strain Sangsue]ALR83612.1 ankyrin repeat protein [Niemeyer virus]AMK61762.1 ankyrin repeat protein [Samba virus]AMZ02548.1 putative ankyrin repeat protein [Mimivirus Bombay]QTF49000.1 putative ankyrin repeat protein [Mimivirus reunion]WMV61443.1 putative ankyrin repeat protein
MSQKIYFKILRFDKTHNDHVYLPGENSVENFQTEGSCVPGRLYFCDPSDPKQNICRYLHYGDVLVDITLPTNDPDFKMIVDPSGTKCCANKIIIGTERELSDPETFAYMASHGVDIHKNYIIHWAFKNFHDRVLFYLLKTNLNENRLRIVEHIFKNPSSLISNRNYNFYIVNFLQRFKKHLNSLTDNQYSDIITNLINLSNKIIEKYFEDMTGNKNFGLDIPEKDWCSYIIENDLDKGSISKILDWSFKNNKKMIIEYVISLFIEDYHYLEKIFSLSCKYHDSRIAEILIKKSINKERCLISACEAGFLEIVECLVKQDVNINLLKGTPLVTACQFGHLLIVDFLVNNSADIHIRDNAPILYACRYGHVDIVDYLIGKGIDIHTVSSQALINACNRGHLNVMELLVEKGADIRSVENILVVEACRNTNADILRFLVRIGVDVLSKGVEPLIVACERGQLAIVQYLIDIGIDICANDNEALIKSCRSGFANIVNLLIENGADVKARDNEALIIACEKCNHTIVTILVSNGADITARNNEALIRACHNEAVGKYFIDFLIEKGADVHARNDIVFDFIHKLFAGNIPKSLKFPFSKNQSDSKLIH